MTNRSLVQVWVLLNVLVVPALADFQAGMDAFNKGDYNAAVKEWLPLAEKGDVKAQFHLGIVYYEGRTWNEAAKWYRMAADHGDAAAQVKLADMYTEGRGVPQDYKEAMKWYLLAADQGEPVARASLGIIYAQGKEVPQDSVQAYMWFELAVAQGHEGAKMLREAIAKNMTPAQIAAAQALSRNWKPGYRPSQSEAPGTLFGTAPGTLGRLELVGIFILVAGAIGYAVGKLFPEISRRINRGT